jgi:hypothetical protein
MRVILIPDPGLLAACGALVCAVQVLQGPCVVDSNLFQGLGFRALVTTSAGGESLQRNSSGKREGDWCLPGRCVLVFDLLSASGVVRNYWECLRPSKTTCLCFLAMDMTSHNRVGAPKLLALGSCDLHVSSGARSMGGANCACVLQRISIGLHNEGVQEGSCLLCMSPFQYS